MGKRPRRTAGGVVVLLLLAACSPGSSYFPDPSAAASQVASNVSDMAGSSWYGYLALYGGQPQVQVVASTAITFAHLPDDATGQADAMAACRGVAAVLNDPATGKPIGLLHVQVMATDGKTLLASCDAP